MGKLVYDGKSVYEIDEDCLRKKEERERQCNLTEYMTKRTF